MTEVEKVFKKVNTNESLTVEEVIIYEQNRKHIKHCYGKYGTLAKQYLYEHNQGKLMIIEDIPEYLHNIDRQADDTYEVMFEKLSKDKRYCRTGDYLEDVKRLNTINSIIEETILNEIVYVK